MAVEVLWFQNRAAYRMHKINLMSTYDGPLICPECGSVRSTQL